MTIKNPGGVATDTLSTGITGTDAAFFTISNDAFDGMVLAAQSS